MIVKLKTKINMELKDIMVSVFPNVKVKENPQHLPLLDILDSIKSGNGDNKKYIATIRKEKDHAKRNDLKVKILPVFCPSGTFERREDNGLTVMSEVICIDLDNVADLKAEINRLKNFPFILSMFRSPSGEGLKVMVVHNLTESSRHKDLYHYVGDMLGLVGRPDLKFDSSCSNISHPCFWSYDSGLYLNKKATPLQIEPNELSVSIPSSKGKEAEGDKVAVRNITKVVLLTDPKEIRKKALETHSLFEEFYSMYPSVRNKNLFVLANFFYNDGIPEDFATDYLVAYYRDAKNGFSSCEIKGIIHSAYH